MATRRASAQRTASPRDELVLTVLPGSRGGEVRRLLPIFGAALRRLEEIVGPFRVVGADRRDRRRRRSPAGSPTGRAGRSCCAARADKYDAFAASRAALAASGTVALELALAGLPMVVAYRLNPLTEMLLDRIVKVRQVNLVNLLLGRRRGARASGRRDLHAGTARRGAWPR